MNALTHRVAVNAYLLFNDRFLLLKRTAPPLIWVPPGGRLHPDEDPLAGLKREIKEETSIEAKILRPVNTWFGLFHGNKLLSIDFLAICDSEDIILSEEHSAFQWLTIQELNKRQDEIFTYPNGFTFSDFEMAWKVYLSALHA